VTSTGSNRHFAIIDVRCAQQCSPSKSSFSFHRFYWIFSAPACIYTAYLPQTVNSNNHHQTSGPLFELRYINIKLSIEPGVKPAIHSSGNTYNIALGLAMAIITSWSSRLRISGEHSTTVHLGVALCQTIYVSIRLLASLPSRRNRNLASHFVPTCDIHL